MKKQWIIACLIGIQGVNVQAQADVAHKGTSDPNLIEATMEQTGVDEVARL